MIILLFPAKAVSRQSG